MNAGQPFASVRTHFYPRPLTTHPVLGQMGGARCYMELEAARQICPGKGQISPQHMHTLPVQDTPGFPGISDLLAMPSSTLTHMIQPLLIPCIPLRQALTMMY